MSNKYYTPEIEEFHVGFEYEINTMTTGGLSILEFSEDGSSKMKKIKDPDKPIWDKSIIRFDEFYQLGLHRDLKTINEVIQDKRIRVKYLDKEDIESLGFEGQEANSVYFKRDGYRLVHWLTNNEIGRDVSIFKVYPDGDEEKLLYKVIVKNKSELKRLLKQLNI